MKKETNLVEIVRTGFEFWKNYAAFNTTITMSPEEKSTYRDVQLVLAGSVTANFENKAVDTYCRGLLFTLEYLNHPAATLLKERYESLFKQTQQ